MSGLTIYGFAPSTYTRTARLVCEEKGVDYELEPVPMGDPENYAKLHPYRKMPVLRHDDALIFETLAIATYVDEVFDGPALQAADPRRRAEMRQWISACNDVVDADLVRAYVKAGANAGAAEKEQAIERLVPIDTWLADRAWLAGSELTLADLFLAPMLAYAIQGAGDDFLDPLPELTRWFETISQRTSFQATSPVNNAAEGSTARGASSIASQEIELVRPRTRWKDGHNVGTIPPWRHRKWTPRGALCSRMVSLGISSTYSSRPKAAIFSCGSKSRSLAPR